MFVHWEFFLFSPNAHRTESELNECKRVCVIRKPSKHVWLNGVFIYVKIIAFMPFIHMSKSVF